MSGFHTVVCPYCHNASAGKVGGLRLELSNLSVCPPATEEEHNAGPFVRLFPVGWIVDDKFQVGLLRLLVDERLGVLLLRSLGSG